MLLRFFEECGGMYINPRDAEGRRLGPFVGYAGRDAQGRQKIGDAYFDYASVEGTTRNIDFAFDLMAMVRHLPVDRVFGMPMGGLALAYEVARQFRECTSGRQAYGFLEKKVTALADGNSREQSVLMFGRHQVEPGDQVIIVEDVVNNRTTSDEAVGLFENAGAEVVAVVCAVNRSFPFANMLERQDKAPIPIVAVIERSTPQWTQDDPEIADDLARLKFVAKPKHERARLQQIMREARGE